MPNAFVFDLVGRPVLSLVGPPLSGLSRPPVSPDSVFRIGPFQDPLHDGAWITLGLFVDESALDVFTNDHLLQLRVAPADAFDVRWAPRVVGARFSDAPDPIGGVPVAGPPHAASFVATTGFDPETKEEIVGLTPPAPLAAQGIPVRPVDGAMVAEGVFPIRLDAGNGVSEDARLHKRTAVVRLKQKDFVELVRSLDADQRLRRMVVAAYALDPETGLVSATQILAVQPR